MKRSTIISLMIALLPIIAFAQNAEEKVKKSGNNQTPVEWEHSKASKEVIIQRLIKNMVYVEGGTFTMGATSEQGGDVLDREKPAHQVTLSSFYIGKYEVTQEEWEAVMGSNPSSFKGAKRPVESVSWSDCSQFIIMLNSLTGKNFRMLTEAEWEYAARGGHIGNGYKYAGSNILDDVSWSHFTSSDTTHEVGKLGSNELGLYDMSGNVWEWCSDWYGCYEYREQSNPTGPSTGFDRVFRGGSWYSDAWICRLPFRSCKSPDYTSDQVGLRLAL